jgi:hypothetical protein
LKTSPLGQQGAGCGGFQRLEPSGAAPNGIPKNEDSPVDSSVTPAMAMMQQGEGDSSRCDEAHCRATTAKRKRDR